MSSITIDMSEERLRRLQAVASELGFCLDDLVRVSIDDFLASGDDKFQEVARGC